MILKLANQLHRILISVHHLAAVSQQKSAQRRGCIEHRNPEGDVCKAEGVQRDEMSAAGRMEERFLENIQCLGEFRYLATHCVDGVLNSTNG